MSFPRSAVLGRRRLHIWCAAVAVLVVLLGGCDGKPKPSSSDLGSGPGAPTLAQAASVVERHGRAVLDHSRAQYLRDVDTAPQASDFRARQARQMTALAALPLRSWSYSVNSPVTDRSAASAAAKRLGAPAVILHLSVSYSITGVDATTASHDLWWTFVKRHGRVYVAGDSDMARLGGAGWRGMWDFGPLIVDRGVSSLVIGHPQNAPALPALRDAVDQAVAAVTNVWGTDWSRQVAVVVPASQQELAALAGQGTALSDISAATVFEATDPLSGTNAVARVVINPSVLTRLSAVGRRIVLEHEITHVATARSTGPSSPRWLVEGFAEYVPNRRNSQPVSVIAGELRPEIRARKIPSALPTDAEFVPGAARLPQSYEEAWLACRLIATRAREAGLVRFYRLVGTSETSPQQAMTTAMQAVLHESLAEFAKQWRAYLSSQLGAP